MSEPDEIGQAHLRNRDRGRLKELARMMDAKAERLEMANRKTLLAARAARRRIAVIRASIQADLEVVS